jgi:hypothetical protein
VINAYYFAEELPLIEARIMKINQMQLIGELLKMLPPLSDDFNHLKRINQRQILLNINDGNNDSNEEIIEKIKSILNEEPEIYCRQVPRLIIKLINLMFLRCKPQTKRQFEFTKKYWPVSFHKNTSLEKKLNGTNFSKNELEKISELFMHAELKKGSKIIKNKKLILFF